MLRRICSAAALAALASGCTLDSVDVSGEPLGQTQDPLYRLYVPTGPAAVSPVGQVADSPSRVQLTWRPLSGYQYYAVTVTQPDGSNVTIPTGWCNPNGSTCWTPFTPVLNGTHSFKVRGVAGRARSRYGTTKTFETQQAGLPTWMGPNSVTGLSVAFDHTCALLSDGSARCWGQNGEMQLGDGTRADRSSPVFVGGLQGANGIGVSQYRSYARMPNGTLMGWGSNGLNGSAPDTPPTAFEGLTGVVSVTGAYSASYAVLTNGTAVSWGSNYKGVLGNGSMTSHPPQPTLVKGLSGITQIAPWLFHACARLSTGRVACWGENDRGQLGLGSQDGSDHPTPLLTGVTGAAEVATSLNASCARMYNGSVQCWGSGAQSCLLGTESDGTTCVSSALSPHQVHGLANVQQLVGGDSFFCARLTDGGVSCWGQQSEVFGTGAARPPQPFLPMRVADDLKASFIAAGGRRVCAIVNATSGKHGVVCWGESSRGEVGNARTADRAAPAWVLRQGGTTCAGSDVLCPDCGGDSQMCCGTSSTCDAGFNCEGNTCRSCGDDAERCCASGSACSQDDLVCASDVCVACGNIGEPCCDDGVCGAHAQCESDGCTSCGGPGEACCTDETACEENLRCGQQSCGGCTMDIRPGNAFACLLREDRTLWCWGDNSQASLGTGDTYGKADPVQIMLPEPGPVMDFATGEKLACALSASGKVYCWGGGRLYKTIVALPAGGAVTALAAGGRQACATRSDGSVYCWNESDLTPHRITLPAVQAPVAIGAWHACARTVANEVYCWGDNSRGQLGTGDVANSSTPKRVWWNSEDPATGNGIIQLVAGHSHTCAVQGDHTLWCWGDNQFGQLGNGITSNQPRPYPTFAASTVPGIDVVTLGAFHSCVTDSSGRVWCWGMNISNQLGRSGDPVVPGMVEGLPESIAGLQAGSFGTCATSVTDIPWCWGAVHYASKPVHRLSVPCAL
jgi:alpha-tubulin suppressor-like RCC1 family protein